MRTCISSVERNNADPRHPFTRDHIESTEEAMSVESMFNDTIQS